MTSHSLARILRQLSEILFKLPDSKIDKTILKLFEMVNNQLSAQEESKIQQAGKQKEKIRSETDQSEVDWEKLIKFLKESDLNDAYKIIENANINTVAMLSELAKRLNINLSGRPKKQNIIHVIIKSLERDRLDETIRSRSKIKDTEFANQANSVDAKKPRG